jgi:hypothetical protein
MRLKQRGYGRWVYTPTLRSKEEVTMRRLTALLTVLLLSGWATVSAQSLADLAKKEKERRKGNDATEVQSFDESNLRSRGRILPQAPPEGGTEAGESAPSQPGEEPEEEEIDPAQTEAYWRNRLAPIDKRIADARAKLNVPGFSQDPTNLIRRQRLEKDLERALADRRAVVEEARRKGVPPGWLR